MFYFFIGKLAHSFYWNWLWKPYTHEQCELKKTFCTEAVEKFDFLGYRFFFVFSFCFQGEQSWIFVKNKRRWIRYELLDVKLNLGEGLELSAPLWWSHLNEWREWIGRRKKNKFNDWGKKKPFQTVENIIQGSLWEIHF